jgi:hypothetical protein
MTTTTQTTSNLFAYRRAEPFTNAEFKFRTALADYVTERLLPKLQARTAGEADANQYTGINVRLADGNLYLEAILTNSIEWGGLGFDFACLYPVKGGLYNLSVRRMDDWAKAERGTVASASVYLKGTAEAVRATDWTKIACGKSFEDCIDLLLKEPTPSR